MKELLFVTGDSCVASKEVLPAVELFKQQHPEVDVLTLKAGFDEDFFSQRTGGQTFSSTPTFVALEDGVILDRHEGKLCEVRLGKMFTGEKDEVDQAQVDESLAALATAEYEIGPDGLRIGEKELIFFSGSWCEYCKTMDGIVEEFSKKHPDIFIRKLDVEDDAEAVRDHCYDTTIYNVPTFFAVVNKKLSPYAVHNGMTNVSGLEELFNK